MSSTSDSNSILGNTFCAQQLRAQIERIAKTDARVLIHGATGSGKESVAHELHRQSKRSASPYVIVNCGAIPESLFESEMFGHERGAFTGAVGQKLGCFDRADGGTLFLDEVGEIPLGLQPKLLRVLEAGTFSRVGGTKEIAVDVRVISATNKHLRQESDAGRWRSDLYHRLNIMPIVLPTLADRLDDVPLLLRAFLNKHNRPNLKLEDSAMAHLVKYKFPGNVRELHNIATRLSVMVEHDVVTFEMLLEVLNMDAFHMPVLPEELSKRNYTRATGVAVYGSEEHRAKRSVAMKANWAKRKAKAAT